MKAFQTDLAITSLVYLAPLACCVLVMYGARLVEESAKHLSESDSASEKLVGSVLRFGSAVAASAAEFMMLISAGMWLCGVLF